MARRPDYVRRVETGDGVRYEVRIHAQRADGSRFQKKRRFTTVEDAVKWHSSITAEVSAGTHIAPSDLTVRVACETWLAGKRIKPTTRDAYTAALAPVIETYGDQLVQKIVKADVEALVAELSAGTGPRGAWKRTSINPMLARWRSVWKDLHAQGILPRNVVALVEPLRKPHGQLELQLDGVLTEAEVEQLVAAHVPRPEPEGATRLERAELTHAAHRELFLHLALLGLRRAEVSGLRWSAIDLDADAPTLTVAATRVQTRGGVVEQADAKTMSSARTLTLPPHLLPILRRVRKEQREMRLALGEQWHGPDDGYVVALDDGRPAAPGTLNSWWTRSLKHAGLPHRRLHDARHTAATLLHLRGAPTATVAAWLGHADGVLPCARTRTPARTLSRRRRRSSTSGRTRTEETP